MAIPQFHQKQWMSQETPSKKKEEEERIQKKISQADDFNSNGGRS